MNPFLKKNDFRVISTINSYNIMLIIHLVKTFLSIEDTSKIKDLINKLSSVNLSLIEKDEELLL